MTVKKANGINVYHYLTYFFERLQYLTITDEMLEQLAPWNEAVKNEISLCSSQTTET